MLDFRIATFLQLCETKSYTKTAKILGMTQPSVTQHIKYLQKKYQCRLFCYEGKTLLLTPEGEYLRRQAESMTKMSKRVAADLKRMSEQKTALRFGFPAELGEARAAEITAALMSEERPVTLHIATMPELAELTESGAIDFALTDKAAATPALTAVSAGKVRFGCYATESLCGEPMHTKRILQQTLLLREDASGDRLVMETMLRKKNLTFADFTNVWESNSPAVLRQMAEAGRGVCFAYEPAMRDCHVVQLPLGEFTEERTLVFLCRKDTAESEHVKQFFEEFKSAWFTESITERKPSE